MSDELIAMIKACKVLHTEELRVLKDAIWQIVYDRDQVTEREMKALLSS